MIGYLAGLGLGIYLSVGVVAPPLMAAMMAASISYGLSLFLTILVSLALVIACAQLFDCLVSCFCLGALGGVGCCCLLSENRDRPQHSASLLEHNQGFLNTGRGFAEQPVRTQQFKTRVHHA